MTSAGGSDPRPSGRRRRRRPDRAAIARSAAFAAAFVLAVALGRATVMEGTSLSLVWPAAGVAAVWFAAQRDAGTRWVLDVPVLAVSTFVLNLLTGAVPALAASFVVANLVQVGVLLALLHRWCPTLWGAGGTALLDRVEHLWRLLAAAVVAAAAGAVFGPTAVGVVTGHWSWLDTVVWLTRNTASVMLIGVAGLRLGAQLAARRRSGHAAGARPVRRQRWRTAGGATELVAVLVVSALAYAVTFGFLQGLPLSFSMITITVWVAVRFDTTFAALHDLVVGVVGVLLTLAGLGQFADVEPFALRALVVQAFVLVTAVTGLSLALFRDERDSLLTEVRHGAARSAEQAQLLSTVVGSIHEGLVVLDASGRVRLQNAAATELLEGTTVLHLDGSTVAPGEGVEARVLAGEEVGSERRLVHRASCPQGRVLDVDAVPLVLDHEGAAGRGAVVVYRDVTDQHRHEAELAAFAGVVAHDLRSPLTALDGWVEVAEEALQDDLADRRDGSTGGGAGGGDGAGAAADVAAALGRARGAARRMETLIGDLLGYATVRQARLHREPVDVAVLLAELVAGRGWPSQAGLPGPSFRLEALQDLPPLDVDPVLVRQLVDNLLGNAVKYVVPGRAADVTVSGTVPAPGWVCLVVADRGIGIPPGQHALVFEDFHRAHRSAGYVGTGLGLGLCRRVVERHAGTITAEENPGGGTRFVVRLPCVRPAAGPAEPAGAAGAAGAAGPAEPAEPAEKDADRSLAVTS